MSRHTIRLLHLRFQIELFYHRFTVHGDIVYFTVMVFKISNVTGDETMHMDSREAPV